MLNLFFRMGKVHKKNSSTSTVFSSLPKRFRASKLEVNNKINLWDKWHKCLQEQGKVKKRAVIGKKMIYFPKQFPIEIETWLRWLRSFFVSDKVQLFFYLIIGKLFSITYFFWDILVYFSYLIDYLKWHYNFSKSINKYSHFSGAF